MKKIFYLALTGWALFELALIYFIMPMPGSQQMESVDWAYFLHLHQWAFRAGFGLLALLAFFSSHFRYPWMPAAACVLLGGLMYTTNFYLSADQMFFSPEKVVMKHAAENKVDTNRLVIALEYKGETRAYPIQFIGYHHQVTDHVGNQRIMVTYCTVCRSGRVYLGEVNGQPERFRLVGMDHFNAMFEDYTTGSWWRQENGVAIAGPLQGAVLPELPCDQMRLAQWLRLHPDTWIMQPDPAFSEEYARMNHYENGQGNSDLTRMDSLSWKEKSLIVGIELGNDSKAFDWNRLLADRVLHDEVGQTAVVLALASDNKSFAAFECPTKNTRFFLRHDTLVAGDDLYDFAGRALGKNKTHLKKVNAYQEFWHSWRVFHPL